MAKKGIPTSLIVILGLVPGLILYTFNVIGFNFEYFPGDLGDGRLNLYFLEHAHKFFSGEVSNFWDAPYLYHETNVIAYSDNLLGTAPVYSLLRLMGFDIYRSYQMWFIVLSVLNYLAAFYFLKYVFKNNYSAMLGAFVFAFSIALQSQLTHAQTFPRFSIPLAFLMAVKFSETFHPRYFFFTLLLIVYQILCGIYLGLMLAVPIGIYFLLVFGIALYSEKKAHFNLKWLLQVLSYGAISFVILLSFMLPYMQRKISPGFEHYQEISDSIPTITSHFFSHRASPIWDFLSKTGLHLEESMNHQIFAGGIATLSMLIAIIWLIVSITKARFRLKTLSAHWILMLTALLTFFFYLRFDDVSAYIALYYLPGFSAMRAVNRVINIELIFFAIATALVFSFIWKSRFRHKTTIFVVTFTLILIDNSFEGRKAYRTKVSTATNRTNQIDRVYAAIPTGSVVSYEPVKSESSSMNIHLDAMLVSQKYNLIAVNGYTAVSPDAYGSYWHEPNEVSRNYWLSNKTVDHGTLYVVKSPEVIEKIDLKEIQNFDLESARKVRLEQLIHRITSDKKWMKSIKVKAQERNTSIDSMVVREATWLIENEQ